MKRHIPVGALLGAVLSLPATAQVLPNGEGVVEFIGLREWTPQRIKDNYPGGNEAGYVHYCAATLIGKLGMIDAAVMHYPGESDGPHVVVTMIEPQDAARVQFRPAPSGKSVPIPAWDELARLLDRSMAAQQGVIKYPEFLARGDAAIEVIDDENREVVQRVWHALQTLHDETQRERAVWALANDSEPKHRIAASVVLLNFADRDMTWWALADGLRDADQMVRGACQQALYVLVFDMARDVDWAPVAGSLRSVLGGTHLFGTPLAFEMLTRTHVAPSLAGTLLGDNAELTLAYAGAEQPLVRRQAHRFLCQLAGADLGDSPQDWRSWVAGLTDAQ